MKLNKAIEIIYNHECDLPREVPDLIAALHLGIHALKRIDECRHDSNLTIIERLPGETREEKEPEPKRETWVCRRGHIRPGSPLSPPALILKFRLPVSNDVTGEYIITGICPECVEDFFKANFGAKGQRYSNGMC